MLLMGRRDLLLAIFVLAGVLALCVEAGNFFDDMGKMFKPKDNKDNQSNNSDSNKSNAVSAKKSNSDSGNDGDDVAAELSKNNNSHGRRRRPSVTNLVNKRRQEDEQAQEDNESGGEQQEEQSKPLSRRRKIPKIPVSETSDDSGNESGDSGDDSGAAPASNNGADKRSRLNAGIRLKPGPVKPNGSGKKGGQVLSEKFKGAFKDAWKGTKETFKAIPDQIQKATDSISALLKLDNKGRLLALIDEVNEDIKFVKAQFSQFSIDWSPLMERSLNYLGSENLQKVQVKPEDELDLRRDALHLIVFGWEMMRLMSTWRQSLLEAHESYKYHLEQVKREMVDEKGSGKEQALTAGRTDVDEYYMFQLHAVHNYLVLTAWLNFDADANEIKMKVDYLMQLEDAQPKNYESDYFRGIVTLQEIYDPAVDEFANEKDQVLSAVSRDICSGPQDPRNAGAGPSGDDQEISDFACIPQEEMEQVAAWFDEFRDSLAEGEIEGADVRLPEELTNFMEKLRPEVEYNTLVYKNKFLKELKKAREAAERAE